ncbi:hypothetical protein [Levilactobacillus spicheri]|uniref:Uncharacterized protein n=3 Tax=Levilactobacillus spicheri TaxID=216463 RepID=A0A0F3RR84_9LACO|nr:hypothetical protein [Levilactobacillus spicheri]KJW12395.1 hypothetical protein VC81_07745 [Levilactobacillus spicheri]KRL48829.1 hypothetical protein FD37_GL001297 [Levilactobacillus spicheri DSM 15429]GEO67808.1 hypothetical protein LSP04_22270 [Levilactobacillus spicheri]
MTKLNNVFKKVLLGTMTVTTLMATSAGASAATRTTVTAEPVQATVTLDQRPVATMQFNRIHLKRTSTKAIANQVQTTVDASALNLDQQHRDQQLK